MEALELEGDLASGAQIFQASCTECHDAGGAGKKSGLVPKIAGQHFTVVVKQIDDFLNGDRDGTVSFLALSSALKTPQDLADIAEYVAAMPRKLETGVGPGIKLDLGKELYEKDCRSCHRDDGRGRADGAFPIIAGQHFGYLYSQIRDMALKRRRNSLPAMVDVISEYSPEELMAVTDYLSRLEWPETQETEYE